jgi:hypothetical protein
MAVVALRWFKAALLLQILLLAYWLATEVVDLFPWNDLAARPEDYDLRQAIAVNALQQLAYMALFALGVRFFATLSALGYGVYLALQLWTWWVPYMAGADTEWRERYGESFARTLKLLPSDPSHLAPDVQHLTLQLLTLATMFATFMAAARMRYL